MARQREEADRAGTITLVDLCAELVAAGGHFIASAVFTVPLQLLAYHVAVARRIAHGP